jgi:prepilin-type N-terminal cleavage/methylation domain-containing protein
MRRTRQQGFTLVELLIALAVGTVLVGIVIAIFITQRRGHTIQDQVAEAQQTARIAADDLARAIKGLGKDVVDDQTKLVHCGPFELIFNSNADDGLESVAAARRIADKYEPTASYGSGGAGAETYRYSLDRNGDGVFSQVDDADATYARHYNLRREVFWGGTGHRTDDVALNLNVTDTKTGRVEPLFRYWGDFDADLEVDLWGDLNNNGELDDAAEYAAAMAPVTEDNLSALGPYTAGKRPDAVIRRVEVRVIAETRAPDVQYAGFVPATAGFRQTQYRTNVTPRNLWSCPDVTAAQPTIDATHDAVASQLVSYAFRVVY